MCVFVFVYFSIITHKMHLHDSSIKIVHTTQSIVSYLCDLMLRKIALRIDLNKNQKNTPFRYMEWKMLLIFKGSI